MSATQFQAPASDADALLRNFRQRRFPSVAQYHAALARYGVTEEEIKQRLVWEVSLLSFNEQRFKTFAEPSDAAWVLTRAQHCHGFYGASSMERLPTEKAITRQTQDFKQIHF